MIAHRRWLAAACLLALTACEQEAEPITKYEYSPYAGEAFPNRRPKVEIPAGGAALVTDSLSDEISIVGLAKGDVIATEVVGRDPVGIDGPHHLVVDPAGGFVFTALSYPALAATGPHAQHGSSVQPGYVQRLALDDFRILGQVRVDTNPGDVVLSDDGKKIVVTHFDLQKAIDNPGDPVAARATLAIIDPAGVLEADSPEPERIVVCAAPHGVALSRPDAKTAYVACYGEDALGVVDLAGGRVKELVPMGPGAGGGGDPTYGPYSAVLSPDGKTVAIGNTNSMDVRFYDVASGTIDMTKTLNTLGAPYFPAWSEDGKLLYVPIQAPHGILVVDTSNANAEVAKRNFAPGECDFPHVVKLEGAESLLVVCEGDHKAPGQVVTLDPVSLATKRTTEVGVYPDALVTVGGAK